MTLVARVNEGELWASYQAEARRLGGIVILPENEAETLLELVVAELKHGEATETQWFLCQLVANAGMATFELEGGETTRMARQKIEKRAARARDWLENKTEWTLVANRGGWGTEMLPIYQMERKG